MEDKGKELTEEGAAILKELKLWVDEIIPWALDEHEHCPVCGIKWQVFKSALDKYFQDK